MPAIYGCSKKPRICAMYASLCVNTAPTRVWNVAWGVDRTHLGGLSGEGTVVLGGQHQQWLRVDGLFLALSL
jgi:hypothetical protein